VRVLSVVAVSLAALAATAVFASRAGAVLVRFPSGQQAGVMPITRVSPPSRPGSQARPGASANPSSSNGNLDYHGGPILHASAPYLVFWDPGNAAPAAEKTLLERYFEDSAADSGKSTNVFGVDRQYTDSTGFADDKLTWSAGQAITDPQPYPSTSSQCTEDNGFSETACLYDSQIRAELQRLVAADDLPTGVGGDAPIYEVILPSTVNTCIDGTSPLKCADNAFCAYHSAFTGVGGGEILYADIGTVLAGYAPKFCQDDGNPLAQQPNGNVVADVATNELSQQTSETITDPEMNAWWDSSSHNEDGGDCEFAGALDPQAGSSPDAFLPVLGGSAAAANLFDQVINSDNYYTQTEWSNGNVACEAEPAAASQSAAFTAPASGSTATGVNFDPSSSSSSQGYTSTTWEFGDGSSSFSASAPAPIAHSFPAPGTYTVTLTLVDAYGNVSTASHPIVITGPPAATFSVTTHQPGRALSPVHFDGSASNELGGSIASYSWNFGDGSPAGTGATLTHAFRSAGTYPVVLTVTDPNGRTAQISHQVVVVGVPHAKLTVKPTHPAQGAAMRFSAAGSTDVGSRITSYGWEFGDGHSAFGRSVRHTYAKPGKYIATLAAVDASGAGSVEVVLVTVSKPAAIGSASVKTGTQLERVRFSLTGAGGLRVSGKNFRISKAGTFTFNYRLSSSQRKALRGHHSLTIKLKATFKPRTGGKASTKTITISVKS
jgi:PKD repeat protein